MKVSRNEIEQHNSRRSCWVAIHGAVYDVTGTLHTLDVRNWMDGQR
jgi:L-lactate dehydrogenase (cytochrome)